MKCCKAVEGDVKIGGGITTTKWEISAIEITRREQRKLHQFSMILLLQFVNKSYCIITVQTTSIAGGKSSKGSSYTQKFINNFKMLRKHVSLH